MKSSAHKILRSVDRLLPAVVFAFLLSFQSLLSTGAANHISFPELIGPDGQILTFADLCNAVDEDNTATQHCASCVSTCSNTPSPIVYSSYVHQQTNPAQPVSANTHIARPEANWATRCGPPQT